MAKRLACLALALIFATPALAVPPGSGWTEVASFDGTMVVTATMLTSGYGTAGDANWSVASADFDGVGNDFTIAVEMGEFTDYFRPASSELFIQDVVVSKDDHLWAASYEGPYLQPVYYTDHLGGSALGWPTDGRSYLPFWGSDSTQPGGCCISQDGGSEGWSQPFTVYVRVEQPVATEAQSWSVLKARQD